MSARAIPQLIHGEDNTSPDWFLKDSVWADATWIFAPTNVLEEEYPVRIRWDFPLVGGRCFTDQRYAPLLESAKQLLSVIRRHTLVT
ncbi:MAG: hypothetical protein ACRDQZ_22150, partial [Mycobacteriales bacterium]